MMNYKNIIAKMNEALRVYENQYQGKFCEEPHVGYGNKKTRCVNEATLPILTCDKSCLNKCAGTCYVLKTCTIPRPTCRNCEAKNTLLRRIDPVKYYDHFFKTAFRENLPIRLSDGGDIENEDQAMALIKAAKKYERVTAILYTKRLNLLPVLKELPSNVYCRYSAWEGDEEGERQARKLGFDVTRVVNDGSSNCPYQISLAKLEGEKAKITQEYIEKRYSRDTAVAIAESKASDRIEIWHCRDCAQHKTGCCKAGEIRFQTVGKAYFAESILNYQEKKVKGQNQEQK